MTDRKTRVALLIDADNLSSDVIDQAVEHLLRSFGAIHFRRAYGSPQKVIEHMELFKRHNIRPMVNVPTGKNSTDIALAVDAIDLALVERPDVVVIASSDSDYAPLAQRLREKGCRVLGIGQAGKTGSDSPLAYDEFIDFAHRRARLDNSAPRGRTAPVAVDAASPRAFDRAVERESRRSRSAAPAASAAPDSMSDSALTSVPTRATTSRARNSSRRSRNASAPEPSAGAEARILPAEVLAILQAVPALRAGTPLQLGEVGEALRRQDLLTSKRASTSRFLKRHAEFFELLPVDKPRTVRFVE